MSINVTTEMGAAVIDLMLNVSEVNFEFGCSEKGSECVCVCVQSGHFSAFFSDSLK